MAFIRKKTPKIETNTEPTRFEPDESARFRLVAISDLHLDWTTDGVERYAEGARAVDFAVSLTIRIGAKDLLVGGDIANPGTQRVHRAVAKCVDAARVLREAGCGMVLIPGNHDVVEDGSGTSSIEPMRFIDDETTWVSFEPAWRSRWDLYSILTLPFTPISHPYGAEEAVRPIRFMDQTPDFPVVILGHLWLEGIDSGSESGDMARGRAVYWPLKQIPKDPRILCLAGHYHKGQRFRGVEVIGSSARNTHGEEDSEPCVVVAEWLGKAWKVTRVPIPGATRLRTIGPDDFADCPNGWKAALASIEPGEMVRVVTPADASHGDTEALVRAVEQKGAHLRTGLGLKLGTPDLSRDNPKPTDLMSAIRNRVDQSRFSDREALFDLCQRLVSEAG